MIESMPLYVPLSTSGNTEAVDTCAIKHQVARSLRANYAGLLFDSKLTGKFGPKNKDGAPAFCANPAGEMPLFVV